MRLRDVRSGAERDVSGAVMAPGVMAVRSGDVVWVAFRGETYRLTATPPRPARGNEERPSLEAPMPGRVLGIRTEVGATVVKGDTLVIVEAMKMEHAVRAPRDGTVTRVLVREGQMVGLGDVLVEMA